MTTISRLLRMIRLHNGEVMLDMANKLGVTSAFLSAVENGRKPAPSNWITKLIELYDLDQSQQAELQEAFDETVKQIRIPVEGALPQKRDLALSFARRFDELGKDEIEAMMRILSKK